MFRIGSAGRLSKEKDFESLIAVVAELIQKGLAVELYIAGMVRSVGY